MRYVRPHRDMPFINYGALIEEDLSCDNIFTRYFVDRLKHNAIILTKWKWKFLIYGTHTSHLNHIF